MVPQRVWKGDDARRSQPAYASSGFISRQGLCPRGMGWLVRCPRGGSSREPGDCGKADACVAPTRTSCNSILPVNCAVGGHRGPPLRDEPCHTAAWSVGPDLPRDERQSYSVLGLWTTSCRAGAAYTGSGLRLRGNAPHAGESWCAGRDSLGRVCRPRIWKGGGGACVGAV